MHRRVTQLQMERLGYQLDIVTNGTEAVAAVQAKTYDMVLMDIEMPIMDGLEATRWIYAYSIGTPGRPYIVALTATAEEARCLAGGMDDYLRKPVGLNDLAATITKGLRRVTAWWDLPV
jgi:CheY-like chemotaxis protein